MVEPVKRVELLTCGLRNRCSATELHRLATFNLGEKGYQILAQARPLLDLLSSLDENLFRGGSGRRLDCGGLRVE